MLINMGGEIFYGSGGYSKGLDLRLPTAIPKKNNGNPIKTHATNIITKVSNTAVDFSNMKQNDNLWRIIFAGIL